MAIFLRTLNLGLKNVVLIKKSVLNVSHVHRGTRGFEKKLIYVGILSKDD